MSKNFNSSFKNKTSSSRTNEGGEKSFGAKKFNRHDKKVGNNSRGKFNKTGKSFGGNRDGSYQKDGIKFVNPEKRRREIDDNTLNLRRMYNKLMLKKEKNKIELIGKITSILKTNYNEYAFKHDGCRFLQGCIKYGSKEQRKEIISALKESIYELATKKYSIFLAIKMWRFAEKEQHDQLLEFIKSKLSKMLKTIPGQVFLNFVFANSTQKIQEVLIKEYMNFSMKINETDLKSLQENANAKMNVDEEVLGEAVLVKQGESFFAERFKENFKKCLETILEKQTHKNAVFHSTLSFLLEYVDHDTKAYISELFDDDFEVFMTAKPGVELAIKLYIVASAKTKKKIIKKSLRMIGQ